MKSQAAIYAIVRVTSDGKIEVQAMGDSAPFLAGQCGAMFVNTLAAKMFLMDHNFTPLGDNVWRRLTVL